MTYPITTGHWDWLKWADSTCDIDAVVMRTEEAEEDEDDEEDDDDALSSPAESFRLVRLSGVSPSQRIKSSLQKLFAASSSAPEDEEAAADSAAAATAAACFRLSSLFTGRAISSMRDCCSTWWSRAR